MTDDEMTTALINRESDILKHGMTLASVGDMSGLPITTFRGETYVYLLERTRNRNGEYTWALPYKSSYTNYVVRCSDGLPGALTFSKDWVTGWATFGGIVSIISVLIWLFNANVSNMFPIGIVSSAIGWWIYTTYGLYKFNSFKELNYGSVNLEEDLCKTIKHVKELSTRFLSYT